MFICEIGIISFEHLNEGSNAGESPRNLSTAGEGWGRYAWLTCLRNTKSKNVHFFGYQPQKVRVAAARRHFLTEEAKRNDEVRDNGLHRGDIDFSVYQAQGEAQTLSPRQYRRVQSAKNIMTRSRLDDVRLRGRHSQYSIELQSI